MKPPLGTAQTLRLLLPFALGYFLSYLFRTANAVIGPVLARELNLGDNALGLLTSTYFLAFGAAQLPLGILLDRYGPRRVEAGLLLLAACGAGIFSLADGAGQLAFGRALIGLGVSACLMASFKAFTLWFPPERQASLTGWIMASGGLGVLFAARPLELAVGIAGWSGAMQALMLATLLAAGILWFAVPDPKPAAPGAAAAGLAGGLPAIFGSRHFWRYTPIAFWFTGGFMAVQGLWAARWMATLEGMSQGEIASRLTGMAFALLAGFLFMGFFSTRLVRHGVRLERLYGGAMAFGIGVFALICWQPTLAGGLLWSLLSVCFSLSNIAYSLVTRDFPANLSGRATTALNLMVFAGAFGLQWGLGGLIEALSAAGWTASEAFRSAFLALLLGQVLAFGWLLRPVRQD